jgi:hypothetical protein
MPMLWIGEIWRLGVILIFFVAFFLGSTLLLVGLGVFIKSRNWKEGIATIA